MRFEIDTDKREIYIEFPITIREMFGHLRKMNVDEGFKIIPRVNREALDKTKIEDLKALGIIKGKTLGEIPLTGDGEKE